MARLEEEERQERAKRFENVDLAEMQRRARERVAKHRRSIDFQKELTTEQKEREERLKRIAAAEEAKREKDERRLRIYMVNEVLRNFVRNYSADTGR